MQNFVVTPTAPFNGLTHFALSWQTKIYSLYILKLEGPGSSEHQF